MCNVAVAQEVLDVLNEFYTQGKIFTAFDVTKGARKRSLDIISHRDVRMVVGTEFNTGQIPGYDRVLCVLDLGSSPQALVYHPVGSDPLNHPLVGSLVTAPALDADDDEKLEDTVGTDSTASTDPDVYKVTAEGRVNIPKKLLDKVDDTGGSIDVVINGCLTCPRPNSDGRIRVGGISAKKVRIVADAKQITIETV